MMGHKRIITSLLVLLLSVENASAFFDISNLFSRLLYSVHICHGPGPLGCNHICPSGHAMCEYVTCTGVGPKRVCTSDMTASSCGGDEDCLNAGKLYNEGYYSDESNVDGDGDADAAEGGDYEDRTYVSGGTSGVNDVAGEVDRNLLPYYVLAGILGVAVIAAVWRKRKQIENQELSEELGPNSGEDLRGSVAKRLESTASMESGETMPASTELDRSPSFERVNNSFNTTYDTDYGYNPPAPYVGTETC